MPANALSIKRNSNDLYIVSPISFNQQKPCWKIKAMYKMGVNLSQIIQQYKEDQQSVFNTWFINNEERLKAFRSITQKCNIIYLKLVVH